jgi:AhpD family alkylhydroperoxidase
MEPRLNFYKVGPDAMKAMAGREQQIARSRLERPLVALVRLRASQLTGCAYCPDLQTIDARKGGESDRRLATLAVWRETPFFSDRERAALKWAVGREGAHEHQEQQSARGDQTARLSTRW